MNTMPNDNSDGNKGLEKSPTKEELAVFERNHHLLDGSEASTDQFPRMGNNFGGIHFQIHSAPKGGAPCRIRQSPLCNQLQVELQDATSGDGVERRVGGGSAAARLVWAWTATPPPPSSS